MVTQMNCNVHQQGELGNECLLGVICNLGKKSSLFRDFSLYIKNFMYFCIRKEDAKMHSKLKLKTKIQEIKR